MIKAFKYFHTQFQEIKTPSSLKLSVKAFEYSYNTNFNKHAQIVKVQTPLLRIKKLLANGLQLHGLQDQKRI